MDPFVSSAPRSVSTRVATCSITNVATQKTIDVLKITRGISIFNSLDVMATSGWIEVMDQGNAIEEYEFNGQEILDLEIVLNEEGYKSAGNSDFNVYKRRFFIYAIEDIAAMINQMVYRIKFIDPFALMNTDTRISWHFKNMKGEDIIKKIETLAENGSNAPYRTAMGLPLSGGNFTPKEQKLFDFKADVSTREDLDIYVPMMKPFELIRYIADRVISSDSENSNCRWSDCLFYQDKNGTYHLNSFKQLFKQKDPIVFSQQIASNATQEMQHLIESYTFNKIYNIQTDKLNGIYGVQFAIADFKPTTKKTTIETVLGTNIMSNSGEDKSADSLKLHESIDKYFDHSLGPIKNLTSKEAGFIEPFQCAQRELQSVQAAGNQGQQKTSKYDSRTGSLIFLDSCGIIHEDDNTYDEFKRVTLPYVTGCIMKKVLSTYVLNVVMNGAFDVDVGRTFIIKLEQGEGPQQMAAFLNEVVWLVSDVRHEWRSDTAQVKTYVTGFTPFLNRGKPATAKPRRES